MSFEYVCSWPLFLSICKVTCLSVTIDISNTHLTRKKITIRKIEDITREYCTKNRIVIISEIPRSEA